MQVEAFVPRCGRGREDETAGGGVREFEPGRDGEGCGRHEDAHDKQRPEPAHRLRQDVIFCSRSRKLCGRGHRSRHPCGPG